MYVSQLNRLMLAIPLLLGTFANIHNLQAITLVGTTSSLLDTEHTQVDAAGGSQPHLLQVATPVDQIHSAIDADILLADGRPLVMTWRRDAEDADIITLSVAVVADHSPNHLEISLHQNGCTAPVFHSTGTISLSDAVNATSNRRSDACFSAGIAPDDDVLVGDTGTAAPLAGSGTIPWQIDISSVPVGGQFDIVIRSGSPGDWDNDHDVDLADFLEFHTCFDAQDLSASCMHLFDLDANNELDLHDFALLQLYFSGEDNPALCGGSK